jgi:hypothetical protein
VDASVKLDSKIMQVTAVDEIEMCLCTIL